MTRLQRTMLQYNCSAADAQRFIDLRDEGHSITQAALMAGLTDPADPDKQTTGDASHGCGEPPASAEDEDA